MAHFGDATFHGDLGGTPLNHPIVGISATGDDGGYWLEASDGGIFNYGDAGFFGSAGGIALNKPIVGMASTIDGGGYWLVATDGGIFSYGDAPFYGSTGAIALNKPIVGMAATPDGGGYWLVASDGGIFAYGDARFYGSAGSLRLNKPIVGMAPTPDGRGLLAGGLGRRHLRLRRRGVLRIDGQPRPQPANRAMAAMPDGGGYWFTAADGGLFNYGERTVPRRPRPATGHRDGGRHGDRRRSPRPCRDLVRVPDTEISANANAGCTLATNGNAWRKKIMVPDRKFRADARDPRTPGPEAGTTQAPDQNPVAAMIDPLRCVPDMPAVVGRVPVVGDRAES